MPDRFDIDDSDNWSAREWHSAGRDNKAVGMAIGWNEDLQAMEFCPIDESQYAPNFEKWNRKLNKEGSELVTFRGPDPQGGEGERTWYRVVGPAAREMYEGAQESKVISGSLIENFAPVEGASEFNLDRSDNQTIWREVEGGVEFVPVDGMLNEDELAKWEATASHHGSTFEEVEIELTSDQAPTSVIEKTPVVNGYKVMGGSLAPKLLQILRRETEERVPQSALKRPSFASWVLNSETWNRSDEWRDEQSKVFDDAAQREMPIWEGAEGFRLAWESVAWMARHYIRQRTLSSMDVVIADARLGMLFAHPVVISPEQMGVLPSMGVEESAEYLQKVRLPFDPLFFDFCRAPGPENMTTISDKSGAHIGLGGGLLMHNQEDNCREVIPFGATVKPNEEDQAEVYERDKAEWEMVGEGGKDWGYTMSDNAGNGLPSHAPSAAILLGGKQRSEDISFCVSPDGVWEPLDRLHTVAGREGQCELVNIPGPILGLGAPADMSVIACIPNLLAYAERDDNGYGGLLGFGGVAVAQMCAIAAAMQLIDSHNVEIREAELTRQVRRKAQRKGIPITSTVYIRHRRTRPGTVTRDPAVKGREFSHSFEVMAHTNHVTRGKHVWCRDCKGAGKLVGPDLPDGSQGESECLTCGGLGLDKTKLTPCARRDTVTGELTCPHGCRKEYVPTFVKGSGPLVMKTRRAA